MKSKFKYFSQIISFCLVLTGCIVEETPNTSCSPECDYSKTATVTLDDYTTSFEDYPEISNSFGFTIDKEKNRSEFLITFSTSAPEADIVLFEYDVRLNKDVNVEGDSLTSLSQFGALYFTIEKADGLKYSNVPDPYNENGTIPSTLESAYVTIDEIKLNDGGGVGTDTVEGALGFTFTENGVSHKLDTKISFRNSEQVYIRNPPIYSPPGGTSGIQGCWDNSPIDAWCFYNNTGQYIQYSVNGNPGTLYIYFDYSADTTSEIIETKNTYTRLVGSCCDKAEAITNASWKSASFSIQNNVLYLGGRSYNYTSSNLGY